MNRTGRPVSPHVQIYSMPIGALLSFGALGVGGIDLIGGSGSALSVMEAIGDTSFFISGPAKLAVAFPIVYHSFGGLR